MWLVDTPGFDDTHRTDAEVFQEIAIWLATQYQNLSRLTAILYMQPINVTRMAGSAMRSLQTVKKMLGVQRFSNLTLVTSMWDILDLAECESQEKELRENLLARFDQGRSSYRSIQRRSIISSKGP
jgi:hypothetical protein